MESFSSDRQESQPNPQVAVRRWVAPLATMEPLSIPDVTGGQFNPGVDGGTPTTLS